MVRASQMTGDVVIDPVFCTSSVNEFKAVKMSPICTQDVGDTVQVRQDEPKDKEARKAFAISFVHRIPCISSESLGSVCGSLPWSSIMQSQVVRVLKSLDDLLIAGFRRLGRTVVSYTGYFIVVPLLLAAFFATGFQRMRYESDPEYLFAPRDGPAKDERRVIEESFFMNHSTLFEPSRMAQVGRFAKFILTAKDGGNIFRTKVWEDIKRLDDIVHQMPVGFEEETYAFGDICCVFDGRCLENDILGLAQHMDSIENGSIPVNYPIMFDPSDFTAYPMSVLLGGVDVDDDEGVVISAKAVMTSYWLRSNTAKQDSRANQWEKKLLMTVRQDDFEHIRVATYISKTLGDELEVNTISVIPYIGVTVLIMVGFGMATLLMGDCVRGKPWLGALGVVSAMMASTMAFGLLMYLGVPFIGINLAAPFLMLGIGIDDMFVLLSAWRRTQIQDPVSKRLSEAYEEAAVSITITSTTNMISFFIGVITPFPSVQIFCLYTGTAVLMTYLWQVTFFGGCMAIAGRMEANQAHSLCCCYSVRPKSSPENSLLYNVFCSGGINKEDPWNPEDDKPHFAMVVFRDYIGWILNFRFVKAVVIIIFLLYLGGAVYGILQIEEGLERRRLSRYDSYSVDFYNLEDSFFRKYPYRIQVVITGDINYSDEKNRKELLDLHEKLENESMIAGPLYTESWIRGWYEFIDTNSEFIPLNTSSETAFISALREYYLSGESNVHLLDASFNENFTRILATRFIIQSMDVVDSNADKQMMIDLRRVAEASPLNVTIFHPLFIFFDQFVLVRSISVKAVCLGAVAMMVVSLLFIPNPWCSLWVAFSIVSIELGVVGYMTLWGVNLDSISMINLIMCVGFSVDFSAHISYAYLTAQVETPDEKVKQCLYNLGLPIIQGALSTIIGVLALVYAPSYIFITFFKTVFLVIFFGAIHGIFLLPVLLSLMGPRSTKKLERSQERSDLHGRNVENLYQGEACEITSAALNHGGLEAQVYLKDSDSLDKDFGLGTSGEESSENSLNKECGVIGPNTEARRKRHRHSSLPGLHAHVNDAFLYDSDSVEGSESNFTMSKHSSRRHSAHFSRTRY